MVVQGLEPGGNAVQQLKRAPGRGLYVGGVTLPMALADLGIRIGRVRVRRASAIVAGHGPTLFAGLSGRARRVASRSRCAARSSQA